MRSAPDQGYAEAMAEVRQGYSAPRAGSIAKSTPIGNIGHALNMAGELSIRLENIVDRLLGPEPTEASFGGESAAIPMGVLPELEERADNMRRLVSRASAQLDRLERALP